MDSERAKSKATTRRRLLAGAAALVAGIAAKQAAQPVAAASITADSFTANGTASIGFQTSGTFTTGVYGVGSDTGVYGNGLTVGVSAASTTTGVYAISYGTGVSAFGKTGVVGNGLSTGIQGQIATSITDANTVAVHGVNQATGMGGFGVYGTSVKGTGVYGQTSASNQYGILGTTYATNSTAIAGTCTQNGSSAFSGGTTNPNAFASFFQGTVVVAGNFAVSGSKSAVVQHPRTGDHRLLYCVESPEAWFEDFGEGTLTGGHAEVKLDPDFTALIHTDGYHVFLTTYGVEGNGLNVTERTASGFTVQERNKGTGNGRFSWRVVAKRADIKGERLGKFTMPNLPLPKPVDIPPQPPPPEPPPKQ